MIPLILDNISMQFKDKEVLNNVCLTIQQGQILGLLGPSGAGKTTLLKIITGQLKQTSGNAQLFGNDCNQLSDEVYRKIGIVMDQDGLYDRLSCYDNLSLFAEINKVDKSKIDEVLTKVLLLDSKKKPVDKLSKGMKQRLVLARAIMHKPALLFLDEPCSGLDPSTTLTIHTLIKELKNQGTTILLTTHNMQEATELCDEVVLLNEGTIVEKGIVSDLCYKYNKHNLISLTLKDGQTVTFTNTKDNASSIASYFELQQVKSIHSSEPNLETVFIELTGRKLV